MGAPSQSLNRRVVLRFDVGVDIGYGHLTRCLAVAAELQAAGCECIAVTRGSVPISIENVRMPASVSERDEGRFIVDELGPSVIVADLFDASLAQLEGLGSACRLVRIEDDEAPAAPCSLLINPNLAELPHSMIASAQSYLGGGDAVLLRRQFSDLPPFAVRDHVRVFVIAFGGSDPVDMTGRTVSALRSLDRLEVPRFDVVIGPGYQWETRLRTLIADAPRFIVHVAVEDMAGILRTADAGIFAAGTLLYEALAVGLPSVLISLNEAQAREASYADAAGAAIHLGRHELFNAATLEVAIASLTDQSTREFLSRRARAMLDGRGCQRAAERIAALVEAS